MTIVVQQRRHHEVRRNALGPGEGRALQRVLQLRHRLATVHGVALPGEIPEYFRNNVHEAPSSRDSRNAGIPPLHDSFETAPAGLASADQPQGVVPQLAHDLARGPRFGKRR
jgi:hypothetical protein